MNKGVFESKEFDGFIYKCLGAAGGVGESDKCHSSRIGTASLCLFFVFIVPNRTPEGRGTNHQFPGWSGSAAIHMCPFYHHGSLKGI